MATPKKPVKKKPVSKSTGAKKPGPAADPKEKKRIIDDEDEDEDYDVPLEELGGYESFEGYEEDDDF
jgi:hypothetical protein